MNCFLALIDLVRIITLTHIVDACHALSSDQHFSRQQRVVLSRECLVSALIPGNSIFIIAGGGWGVSKVLYWAHFEGIKQ